MLNKIVCGDCIEVMGKIKDRSIDMILCDLPYGMTVCSWDVLIPFDKLWSQYKRIIKDNGAIVLTAQQPFTSKLIMSNLDWFRYCVYWQKEKPTNFFQLKRRFGKTIEDICVFYNKQPVFHPQMTVHSGKLVKNSPKGCHNSIITGVGKKVSPYIDTGLRYPTDVIKIKREKLGSALHPTQKPVELFEYLVKTYTEEGDLVLDNCIGSGTTAVACIKTNRQFIGIELDEKYCEVARERINMVGSNCDDSLTG